MFALVVFLFAAILLIPPSFADSTYTVWSSVVFVRAGDHTPLSLGSLPTTLTSLGAQQLYSVGQFFRSRYITDGTSPTEPTAIAPLAGLNEDTQNDQQMYVLASNNQYVSASAQAFMQGLYPPQTLESSTSSTLDIDNVLANGTYIAYPNSGMNLPHVQTAGSTDPNSIYVAGDVNCPAIDAYTANGIDFFTFTTTQELSQEMYWSLEPILSHVMTKDEMTFYNAWSIYDYVSYLATHNTTVADQLGSSPYMNDTKTNVSNLDQLRWLADQQQYAYLGDLTVGKPFSRHAETATTGSISTIAGATLASEVAAQLALFVQNTTSEHKLTLLFGDYDPMMSFASLVGLPSSHSNFYGLPAYGSAMVFELVSYTNGTTDTMPSASDLHVRFSFRNGTNDSTSYPYTSSLDAATASSSSDSDGLTSYPLSASVGSDADMPYNDFVTLMSGIAINDVGDWCLQCGAANIFCAAWNITDGYLDGANGNDGTTASQFGAKTRSNTTINGVFAGIIGAVVGLSIAGLVAAIVGILAGFRIRRVQGSAALTRHGGWTARGHGLAGFKGNRKLASDQDLTLPKGGAVVASSVEKSSLGGDEEVQIRERVGSWELKSSNEGNPGNVDRDLESQSELARRRSSVLTVMTERIDPFQDPVRPYEGL